MDGLTPSQHLALEALIECRSMAAAARQSGVGERSIRRWMRQDENFQAEVRRLREDALGRASLVRTALDFAFRSGAYEPSGTGNETGPPTTQMSLSDSKCARATRRSTGACPLRLAASVHGSRFTA